MWLSPSASWLPPVSATVRQAIEWAESQLGRRADPSGAAVGRLTGMVRSPEGTPLAGVRFKLSPAPQKLPGLDEYDLVERARQRFAAAIRAMSSKELECEVVTDGKGHFVAEALPADRSYDLRLARPSPFVLVYDRGSELAPGAYGFDESLSVGDHVEVRLRRGVPLQVEVRAPHGDPPACPDVEAEVLWGHGPFLAFWGGERRRHASATEGPLLLLPGAWRLRARSTDPTLRASPWIDVDAPSTCSVQSSTRGIRTLSCSITASTGFR